MEQLASFLMGTVVGLIAVTIFAVILRRLEERYPKEAFTKLVMLIGLVLGGGTTDYLVFDWILKSSGVTFYIVGISAVFLPLGMWNYLEWMRKD